MKKLLAIVLAGTLLVAALPNAALAGDRHAVSNRWAGVAIGAAAAVVGGALLSALAPAPAAPVAYGPPPVVYAPPSPVMYAPPAVVYATPPVVYAPAPVIVHREVIVHRPVVVRHEVGPRGHWDRGHGWDHR